MASATLKTLGEFALTHDGRSLPLPPTKKARALVAYLVMHRATDVSREQLLEVFWRDFDPERARDNLNATLWSVRRMFRNAGLNPDEVVRADRTIVRWHAPVEFDVDRLLELAEKPDRAAAEEALSLYRGDFLEGDFDDWSVAERERISLVYETLLSRATRTFGSITAAEQLIGRNPYDETAYATLIESQLETGQTLAAAILVERCRRALEEVGTRPSDRFEERFGTLRRPRDDAQSELRIPFVARDRELRFLEQRFRQCAAGEGSVTLIHGDAGIGKSTLLTHASRIAFEHCSQVINVGCSGDDREALDKAGEGIATATRPFVVVVDDAQNLAADALLLFVSLLEASAERHCFVVATRPEALADLRSRLERCAPLELALGPLSRNDVEGALRQAAGSELSEVSAKLFERTAGHPLYIVRLLEALVESGALERRQRTWDVTDKFDESLPLPGSVRSFIEARLLARGSLPATVAGALAIEPFATAADLGAVLRLDEEALLDALDDLLALGLIRQPQVGPQFEFSHDLIREVSSAQLNAGRAVRIHRLFAELLQRAHERNAPSRIAIHLLAAGDVLGAGHAFVKVAQHALETNAFFDCIAACDEAIAALGELEKSAEGDDELGALYRMRSNARFAVGQTTAALEDADKAVGLERGGDSAVSLGRALITRARYNSWAGARALVVHDLEEAAAIGRDLSNTPLLSTSLEELSAAARARGERDSAFAFGREAYELAFAEADWPRAQSAVGELLLTSCAWWDISNASQLAATSLELMQRCGEAQLANHFNVVALLSYVRERYDDAKGELAKASQIDKRISPPTIFFNQLMSALIALVESRWGDALEITAKMESWGDWKNLPAQRHTLASVRIEAFLSRDAPGDAEHAEEACASAGDGEHMIFPWNICSGITRARVAARLGRGDADILLRNALDAVEERAHEIPFDADRAYAQVELASRAAGNEKFEARAVLQGAYYRRLRRTAAGEGRSTISLPVFTNTRIAQPIGRSEPGRGSELTSQ
jgi:DNA-binding SARP family transcriptional activator